MLPKPERPVFEGTTIMPTVNILDAQAHLPQIIADLNPGDSLLITDNALPVATLTRNRPKQWPCKAGSAINTTHWMAPDFDGPIEEFGEYME